MSSFYQCDESSQSTGSLKPFGAACRRARVHSEPVGEGCLHSEPLRHTGRARLHSEPLRHTGRGLVVNVDEITTEINRFVAVHSQVHARLGGCVDGSGTPSPQRMSLGTNVELRVDT
jgi:hypothetical protein